mgnify:CR=1 FL=1
MSYNKNLSAFNSMESIKTEKNIDVKVIIRVFIGLLVINFIYNIFS